MSHFGSSAARGGSSHCLSPDLAEVSGVRNAGMGEGVKLDGVGEDREVGRLQEAVVKDSILSILFSLTPKEQLQVQGNPRSRMLTVR